MVKNTGNYLEVKLDPSIFGVDLEHFKVKFARTSREFFELCAGKEAYKVMEAITVMERPVRRWGLKYPVKFLGMTLYHKHEKSSDMEEVKKFLLFRNIRYSFGNNAFTVTEKRYVVHHVETGESQEISRPELNRLKSAVKLKALDDRKGKTADRVRKMLRRSA